ncbi:type I-E CRISPR-associated protein Cse1/CasA [Actinocorallia sp. A-T 12471]|uniref:type I-E CRISPR-associated protein Cse1/CasA n=1 Tax=Actinocorallia sp. A-T 12471 TaxID=3089813 RepID=UPI0029CFD78A|nr:type I-E CRISPR-associated protein Cse1/CasA [Actinocorallia sp. A-T 12471]MDX6740254.1 type I-E CRISPR-associated protein Cse1/CasA [Actinocorallia sp. A-T 12471]
MSRPTFDLRITPWASVRWRNPGEKSESLEQADKLSLEDLLIKAHEIEALLFGPPPALSGLLRLLYALTARVTGLDEAPDDFEWYDRRADILENGIDADDVRKYFDRFPGRFDLFSERPFLQDPRLAEESPKRPGVNKLVIGRPAGNNAVWFGHHWDSSPVPVDSAEAFAHLLMWLYYGPSGRCATRTHGAESKADVSAGPLRSSLSYHPEGRSLLETLLAGLTLPDEHVSRENDLCPWETDELHDPTEPARAPSGPCSQLTGGWQHALLLFPDDTGDHVVDACITWGRRHKAPSMNDPYVIHQTSKQGNVYARPADAGRALWRDLDGLLLLDRTGSTTVQRPDVFKYTDELGLFHIQALGFEQDGKTKDVQFVSSRTPQPVRQIRDDDPNTARATGDLRSAGEMYGQRVEYAVKVAWAGALDKKTGPCAWQEEAAALYWPQAEDLFWERLAKEDFTEAWRDFLRLAHETFSTVTDGYVKGPRAARAIERARLELYGGRRKKPSTSS